MYGCRPSPRAEPHLKGLLGGTGLGASGWAMHAHAIEFVASGTIRAVLARSVCEDSQRDIHDMAHILHIRGVHVTFIRPVLLRFFFVLNILL